MANIVTRTWDSVFLGVRRPLGLVGSPVVLPYRKFGTPHRLRVAGRVVEDRGVVSAAHTPSTAANLWLTFKRYAAYEIPDAEIRIRFGVEEHSILTDRKGFFEVEIKPSKPVELPPFESWFPVKLSLLNAGPNPLLAAEARWAKAEISIGHRLEPAGSCMGGFHTPHGIRKPSPSQSKSCSATLLESGR